MMTDHEADVLSREKSAPFGLDRREFLKRIGGGVVVLFATGPAFFDGLAREARGADAPAADLNAYLRIGEDGRVTCFTGKIEMGQGIHTSLGQMLADELDVSYESVDMLMGDTDLCPYDRGTWGSLSTRVFGPELRAAGAQAKVALLELAAEHLDTDLSQLEVREGVVYGPSGAHVSYAELTRGKEIVREVTGPVAVKAAAEFKVMGRSFKRRDGVAKVTGAAKYAGDIRLPGMLAARILRPPAHDAELKSVDTSKAEAVEGVQVVRTGDMIAVLHRHRDVAEMALGMIETEFDVPESNIDQESIFDHLLGVAPDPEAVASGGDLALGASSSKEAFAGTYLDGYVAHAPMEPHVAAASMENGKMTVWASTQSPFGLKESVMQTLDLPEDKVRVITPFVGGGFGGKSPSRQGVEAAVLANHVGKPVQVFWSREEEFFFDYFRPAAVVKIDSGLDASGRLSLWDYTVYFAGQRGSVHYYDIPHHRTQVSNASWRAPGVHPFDTGAWRAPAANTNTFARESQIDIMATMAGADPLEFRLEHLSDEKMIGVLKAAADRFGWTPGKPPSGRGYGIACGIDADTYVATMAEVDVDEETGRVKVNRMVCAQDMGLVINPVGAKMQMEGCLTMGLGYALSEEVRFKGGAIHDLNFGTYQLPQFSWVPEIETVLIESTDPAPHGGGEPAIITVGGVIANAIFDATGARVFRMPMTPARVKEAIAVGN